MPAYVNSPFQSVQLLQKGVPAYLIGSFSQQTGRTDLALTNVALTTNVATVTVQVITGPLPIVGEYISILNSASTSGLFNVNRAIITATTVSASTGAGTISFALTHADVVSAADVGRVVVEPAEVGESVTSSGFTSVPCVVAAPEGDSQFTLPFCYTSGATQTAATATLQVAINANSGEWTNTTYVVTKTGATTYTAGPVVQATLQRGYAYRVLVSAVTGTDLAVAKIG
jgi:hypothetical protein